MSSESQSRRSVGSEFQSLGVEEQKARSPCEAKVRRTLRRRLFEDLS